MTWSFDIFFDLRLNKRLSKQSWGCSIETPSCLLWRHCNALTLRAYIQHCGSPRMYILVKLHGFHTMMNGLDAVGYIMASFRGASWGNLCEKHYSTHHMWPVIRLCTQCKNSHLNSIPIFTAINYNTADMKKIKVRTPATPSLVWLLNSYIQISCLRQCRINCQTYCLISVFVLIILSIYFYISVVLQLFAFGIFLMISKYECVCSIIMNMQSKEYVEWVKF